MAMKRKPRSSLSKSGKYYRDNPKAAAKKKKYDTKFGKSAAQRKKRSALGTARRKAKKAGKNIAGKDASHTKNGIVFKDYKKNRGSKTDSAGDRRSRGKKRKKRR